MSLLPPDADLELIHTRTYETKVYQVSDDELLVRGAVSDMKPPGLYLEEDPDELEIHQMQVELRVGLPSLEITQAAVRLETHPHESCPSIEGTYQSLVGLSIARGFGRSIRELFGGPRGCTHTTALLNAMAPAVVQSTWSVMIKKMRESAKPTDQGETTSFSEVGPESSTEERRAKFESNLNTCHVWHENGPHVGALRSGESPPIPLQIRRRIDNLGINPAEWTRGGG